MTDSLTPDHVALALGVLYGALVLVARVLVHLRRTGTTGLVLLRGGAGRVERLSGLTFVVGSAAVFGGPLLHLARLRAPLPVDSATFGAGVALYAYGLALTAGAQHAMGASWRVGVDAAARTPLVTQGPFASVRNPIFTGLLLAAAGVVLLAPGPVTISGWLTLLGAIELQVRRVEEPYLLRVHGPAYAAYAARTGRFLPALGTLAPV